jgi:NADPH:quinone reductase-like Zn-dependent oxidoreductase
MANQPMIINPGDLIFKQTTIKGFWAAKLGSGPRPAEIPRAIGEIVRLAAAGELKLPLEKVFPLEEAAAAAEAARPTMTSGLLTARSRPTWGR